MLAPFVPDPGVPLTVVQLARFLRNPVKVFFRQRLGVIFDDEAGAHGQGGRRERERGERACGRDEREEQETGAHGAGERTGR